MNLSRPTLLEGEVHTRVPLLLLTKFTLILAPYILTFCGSTEENDNGIEKESASTLNNSI